MEIKIPSGAGTTLVLRFVEARQTPRFWGVDRRLIACMSAFIFAFLNLVQIFVTHALPESAVQFLRSSEKNCARHKGQLFLAQKIKGGTYCMVEVDSSLSA